VGATAPTTTKPPARGRSVGVIVTVGNRTRPPARALWLGRVCSAASMSVHDGADSTGSLTVIRLIGGGYDAPTDVRHDPEAAAVTPAV
jgi:hypothetical protein